MTRDRTLTLCIGSVEVLTTAPCGRSWGGGEGVFLSKAPSQVWQGPVSTSSALAGNTVELPWEDTPEKRGGPDLRYDGQGETPLA